MANIARTKDEDLMFKNVLNSLGVDTVHSSTDVVVGEPLRGEVRIKTGEVEQDIRGVVLELVARCLVETRGDDKAAPRS